MTDVSLPDAISLNWHLYTDGTQLFYLPNFDLSTTHNNYWMKASGKENFWKTKSNVTGCNDARDEENEINCAKLKEKAHDS